MNKKEQIEHNFTYHAPKPGQPARYQSIREKAKVIALLIDEATTVTPPEQSMVLAKIDEFVLLIRKEAPLSSEQSQSLKRLKTLHELIEDEEDPRIELYAATMAFTKLEEAVFWANAAIARHE